MHAILIVSRVLVCEPHVLLDAKLAMRTRDRAIRHVTLTTLFVVILAILALLDEPLLVFVAVLDRFFLGHYNRKVVIERKNNSE